jgi:hypothetical protein
MKYAFVTFLAALVYATTFGQQLISGDYNDGLKLCYDSATKKVTGYFEEGTGYDEQTNSSRFSCIFYIEGTVSGKKFKVNTYFPADKKDDLVTGTMELVSNTSVNLVLPQDHGGCWNVQPFTKPVDFTLDKKQAWIQIRYVNIAKAYFYSEKLDDKRTKIYLVKADVVCVEKIEAGWAYCTYFGKKVSKGWVKVSELNIL